MRRSVLLTTLAMATATAVPITAGRAEATATPDELVAICEDLWADQFAPPNPEPYAQCQWDMALIDAGFDSYAAATGEGVTVGVIDSGVDIDHPDIAPNLDLDLSCSFITDETPTAAPSEIANGDCDDDLAVDDLAGHGTHVASTIAAPINGVGIAGVAPDATIVALKACTIVGYCFADSVAAALRYAGDHRLDVVNLSLFADPFLYYCRNDKDQRAILRDLQSAARYAQQRGVVIVASAGNEEDDLQHPTIDEISPDWPPDTAEVRDVGNQCIVAPAELPEALTVSATGPSTIASYSSVGMGVVDVTAPGGDYLTDTGTVQDAVLGALPKGSDIWNQLDPLEPLAPFLNGLTVDDGAGATYAYLNGTSMSAPHAAGVAALVVETHPNWSPKAVQAAVERTATPMPCPADWEPLGPEDDRARCYGAGGRTSFFGAGMVNALRAATT